MYRHCSTRGYRTKTSYFAMWQVLSRHAKFLTFLQLISKAHDHITTFAPWRALSSIEAGRPVCVAIAAR